MRRSVSRNNFTIPFEGKPHKGTIIELPYRADTWRLRAEPAMKVFLNLVTVISAYEHVYLIADPILPDYIVDPFRMDNVEILRISYNDSWARDNTLIFLSDGENRITINFDFNAWGGSVDGLYKDWSMDRMLGERLAAHFGYVNIPRPDFILEGGSIHSDGEGTLLTTEACLLSAGRNSRLTKKEIEIELMGALGIEKILWLPHGIYNDETNEHVDNMACFLAPGVIALAMTKDENDVQYQYSMEAYEYLQNETDAKGRHFTIVPVYVPSPQYMSEEEAEGLEAGSGIERPSGNRLAASYINFYMSDKFVIVPQFGVPEDKEAMEVFKNFYKDKDVIGLDSREILLAGGNIHCVTMQIPAVKGDKK